MSLRNLHEAQERSRRILLLVLAAMLSVSSFLALAVGPVPIGAGDIWAALWPSEDLSRDAQIVQQIRLPRLILGLCVGAVLGVCGAALQGLFRNPLADPGIIGVSSGAALAAGLVIVTGNTFASGFMEWAGNYALPLGAFAGSMIAIVSIYALSQRAGTTSGASLILAGIAINAMAGAALGYLTFLSSDNQLRQLTFWTLGSLGRITWDSLVPVAVLMTIAVALTLRKAAALNTYLLGEREAGHLGLNVERMKKTLIVLGALGVGSAVAVSGIIGFVGLAAPHIIRLFAGADHRIVLPGSALLGALLVMCADLIARTAAAPAELPIGVLTSALGGPFFLWLLGRYRRELF
ncbi:MAG: iron ABC transporter permease [Hyphomicrobiales bacterium]|nr:iron ABC transporter permease [Hyphomicrobiales bacterium]